MLQQLGDDIATGAEAANTTDCDAARAVQSLELLRSGWNPDARCV